MQYIKIPMDRVGVLIGVKGSVKKTIEEKTNTKITISDGDVTIDGDPLGILKARDVVIAIARGFNPEIAFKLFDDDNVLDIINLREITSSEREMIRKKGRVIGKNGRTREFIENMTNTYISVYGKTIAIIGSYEGVEIARNAIMKLIDGMSHSSVYRFIEKEVAELKSNFF